MQVFMGMLLCLIMVEIGGTWAWDWDRDNYSTINRHSRHSSARIPHVGVRRSIFDRFLGDSTPNNPFLTPHAVVPRIRPRLSENDFIISDDDYEDVSRNFHWFPQTQHSNLNSRSLEGLEHILEGKLGPINDPSLTGYRKMPQVTFPKEEKEKKQKNRQRKHRQHLTHEMSPSADDRARLPSERPSDGIHHLPVFGAGGFSHEGRLLNNDHFSKDILHDFQEQLSIPEQLSMPEHFTNPKQFPKDFISPEQFPTEFDLLEPSPRDQLTTDPFVSELGGHEPFQDHLLLSSLPNSDFQNSDHMINLNADQTLSEVDLPQIFPNLGLLGKITPPEDFMHQERLGHFGLPNGKSPNILPPESGEGLPWLPPSLQELNLPSHGHMFSSFEQQKQSKEAHRDACHARNLHSCGSRLIDEFAFGPNNPDKCRIREEFLDCMEQVMKLPCELHGERYSREGTKLIRDKIKTLLWSAQGCILGYST